MESKMNYLLLIVGFFMLIKGADIFVDGCCAVARKLGIPSMIIGLTIVAMGTSAPEAAVSIAASFQNNAGIAVGNVVGSNIFNLLLIIGVCLFMVKMKVAKETLFRDYPFYLGAMVLLGALSYDGTLSREEGIILTLCIILYMIWLVRDALKSKKNNESEDKDEKIGAIKTVIFIVVGIAAVAIGGDVVVDSASGIAKSFGLSDQLIGLTIVAIGTSLPELVTSMAAIRKKELDLAVGNVIGSNIFNALFILGIASLVNPVPVSSEALIDVAVCIAASVVSYGLCLHKKQLNLVKGIIFIAMYVAIFTYVLMRG